MPRSLIPLVLASLALASLLLIGCGSSGGGTTTVFVEGSSKADLFTGSYAMAAVLGSEDSGSETFRAFWSMINANGVNEVFGVLRSNYQGVISTSSYSTFGTYAVEEDLRFSMESEFAGLDHELGGLTEAGDLGVLSMVTSTAYPLVRVFGRREPGSYNLASLSGAYHMVGYGSTVAGDNTFAEWGSVSFDGIGGGTSETSVNQEGATFGPVNIPITYTVAGDGQMTLAFAGGLELEGAIAVGGDVLILGGATVAGDHPRMMVLVRAGAGLGNADMDGLYTWAGMRQEIGSNFYRSYAGHMAADGMGSATRTGLVKHEDHTTWFTPDAVTTTVQPDGSLTLLAGITEYVGGISPDGRFAILAGPTNAGLDPTIWFLLR